MRALFYLKIAFLFGCAVTPNESSMSRYLHQDCWQYTTEQVPGILNVMHLCISEGIARMEIYYPNRSAGQNGQSTICRQAGVATRRNDSQLSISLSQGECENGRELQPFNLDCEIGNTLNCRDREYFLTFRRSNAV